MRTDIPQPIRLSDYRPPEYLIDTVHLDFDLQPAATRVKATLSIRRNGEHARPLVLNGEKLRLISAAIDGVALSDSQRTIDAEFLTIPDVPASFTLDTEVEINPQDNKALTGLYMSGGRFCTQCEAEGFRTITFFPDRPDVLSTYSVRIEADASFPHLLSNGNLTGGGPLGAGRHFAEWSDPFKKPCYLFALVAGELDVLEDSLVTMTGRTVALKIYVDPGQTGRAVYAMDALKRAMQWDEQAFGREYDLDLFMIVAVRDFNFGAMENKGLNIFNSSLLLADQATATDADYERIESVVAHEYFHNWTGDRITCRDWFQLCLKEGLTVFRDQSFSADQRGAAVQRIKDVRALRSRQFAEDASPMAHPVRPSSYLKIDNFYTATIYEKGSEVIRMLKTLLGADVFRAGMDLYFERHDGEATTVEAFIACFADASGRDLGEFFHWYEQAGTPRVTVAQTFAEGVFTLEISQQTLPTPGQPDKQPLPIPLAFGLLNGEGEAIQETKLVLLDTASTRVHLQGMDAAPVVSMLRGFSAPVILTLEGGAPRDRYVLLSADPDLFNRWEAGQTLSRDLILKRAAGSPDEVGEERFAGAVGQALADTGADPAFKALLIALPSETDLAQAINPVDPAALHEARDALRARIAVHLGETLRALYTGLQDGAEFSPDAEQAGRRAMRNALLDMLAADPHGQNLALIEGHFAAAANMTDAMGGLWALAQVGGADFDKALATFHDKWRDEPLVIDKWFSIQGRDPGEGALARVQGLLSHPDFDPKNPNRLRALVGAFTQANPARFHDPSGEGYRLLADRILETDAFNPMTAARLLMPLGDWARYAPQLRQAMRGQLQRIASTPGLSKNVLELASKALA